ncbi:MAG: putative oxygen-independent coproporphyrinogen oxidase [Deltaproteobacteria bacterium]|nr:putative oxygen-independent coproporphyrinogen oxidase [Deltaproteobacteria bacterium]
MGECQGESGGMLIRLRREGCGSGAKSADNDFFQDGEVVQRLARTERHAGQRILGDAGHQRYEVSNYAKLGYVCRHNLLYWTNGEYLGLGPSAQSYQKISLPKI